MHTSGLQTVAVTVEELTIKVRLLNCLWKNSYVSQDAPCFLLLCGFLNFFKFLFFVCIFFIYIFYFPISSIPEIPILELLCVGKTHCVFIILTVP